MDGYVYSGGTDIIACFMGQTWDEPVHRGEIQQMILGCDMGTLNEDGLHTPYLAISLL